MLDGAHNRGSVSRFPNLHTPTAQSSGALPPACKSGSTEDADYFDDWEFCEPEEPLAVWYGVRNAALITAAIGALVWLGVAIF